MRRPLRDRVAARIFSLCVLVVGTGALAGPALTPYEDEFYEVSEKVVTPHIPWARPLVGGAVRVLFIAPMYCHRHTVEMAQRLDLDYDVVGTTSRREIGLDMDSLPSYCHVRGLDRDGQIKALRRKLAGSYDVIVLGTDWGTLPLQDRYEILHKVDQGTGLLIGYRQKGNYLDRLMKIGSDVDAGWVSTGVPFAEVSNLAQFAEGNSVLSTSSLGDGRVLMLNYALDSNTREFMTPRENTPATEHDYDVYQSLAIRSLLWCAKRELSVQLTGVAPAQWNVIEEPETVKLAVVAREAVWRATIEATWRDPTGKVLDTQTQQLRLNPGESTVDVPVPPLPAGLVFADVRVLRDGAICGWSSIPVRVASPLDIADVTFPKELFGPGDPIAFKLTLSQAAPERTSLALTVRDAHGRTLAGTTVSVPAGQTVAEETLSLSPPLSVWHELAVQLRVEDRCVAEAREEFWREWRRPDDAFTLVGWYGPSKEGYMDQLIAQQFAASGLDTVYLSHVWGDGVDRRVIEPVRAGLAILPYICAVRMPRLKVYDPHVRTPCLHDPKYRGKLFEQVELCARDLRRFCPAGYSLGDENYFAPHGKEYCAGPDTVTEYRRWLARKYATPDALTKAWGVPVDSFDAISPLFLTDARQRETPAPWVDWRLFTEAAWTQIFADLAGSIGELDSHGKVGHEGSGRIDSYGAFDWWSMLRDISLFVPYPGHPVGGEMVRSFANPGTMSAYWYGAYTRSCGGRRLTTQRYFPWFCLFQGFNASWYFNLHGHAGMAHEVGFAGDLRPLPHFEETSKACREIKTGLDMLLLNSALHTDGVCLYYSPASVHENTFSNRPAAHATELLAWCELLQDLGVQYRFVSADQVSAGELSNPGCKLLILPMVTAVTDREAKGIAEFARAGGSVLADVPPGTADPLGRPRQEGALVELFGAQPSSADLALTVIKEANAELPGQLGSADTTLLATPIKVANGWVGALRSAATIDVMPILLRSATKPKCILLNFAVDCYRPIRTKEAGTSFRTLMTSILQEAGVGAAVTLTGPDGTPLPDVRISRFTRGNALFIGIMSGTFNAKEETTRHARISLPKAGHVYDMRRKRYLGLRRDMGLPLTTCRPVLLAVLEEAVTALTFDAQCTGAAATRELRLTGKLMGENGKPAADVHAVRLRIFGPDRLEREHYTGKVLTKGGQFSFTVPMALSDAPGQWFVSAEDVVSGIADSRFVEVK